MADTTSKGIPYPELSDAADVPLYVQQLAEYINNFGPFISGLLANRPGAASVIPAPAFYWATDTSKLYISDGAAWSLISIDNSMIENNSVSTAKIIDNAITSAKVSANNIRYTHLHSEMKPVQGAPASNEALRQLGGGAHQAYPGNLGANLAYRLPALEAYYTDPNNPVPLAHFGPIPAAIPITGGWTDFGRFIVSTGPSPVRDKTWRTRVTIGGTWFGNGNYGNLTLFIGSNIGSGPWSVAQSFGSGAQNVSASGPYTALGAGRNLWVISMLANMGGGGGGAALYVHDILIEGYVV